MSIIIRARKDEDVPADYIKCSKDEALTHHWKLIDSWRPTFDTWPFRYGPGFLSAAGLVSGGLLSTFTRHKLDLKHFGRIAMLLPTMGIPGAFSPIFNLKLVTEPILLQNECPICIQMRSMLVQNGIGVVYPLVVGSASGLFLAEKYATYRLPEFSFRAVPQFIKIAINILLPYKNKVIALVILNCLVAAFVAERQANSVYTIARKLEEREAEVE